MPELTWTKVPPTKQGWYYLDMGSGNTVIAFLIYQNHQFFFLLNGMKLQLNNIRKSECQWAGPLPEPE